MAVILNLTKNIINGSLLNTDIVNVENLKLLEKLISVDEVLLLRKDSESYLTKKAFLIFKEFVMPWKLKLIRLFMEKEWRTGVDRDLPIADATDEVLLSAISEAFIAHVLIDSHPALLEILCKILKDNQVIYHYPIFTIDKFYSQGTLFRNRNLRGFYPSLKNDEIGS